MPGLRHGFLSYRVLYQSGYVVIKNYLYYFWNCTPKKVKGKWAGPLPATFLDKMCDQITVHFCIHYVNCSGRSLEYPAKLKFILISAALFALQVTRGQRRSSRPPKWLHEQRKRPNSKFNETFPFDRASPPDICQTSQFENVIGFLRGFLLKNHPLPAPYLGFEWSSWRVLIKREIIVATRLVWPVSLTMESALN